MLGPGRERRPRGSRSSLSVPTEESGDLGATPAGPGQAGRRDALTGALCEFGRFIVSSGEVQSPGDRRPGHSPLPGTKGVFRRGHVGAGPSGAPPDPRNSRPPPRRKRRKSPRPSLSFEIEARTQRGSDAASSTSRSGLPTAEAVSGGAGPEVPRLRGGR